LDSSTTRSPLPPQVALGNRLYGEPRGGARCPVHIALTPDGRRAYVSNYLSNNVAVVDVRTRRVLRRGTWHYQRVGLVALARRHEARVERGALLSLNNSDIFFRDCQVNNSTQDANQKKRACDNRTKPQPAGGMIL
jgi:hypothetical protein